MLGSHMLALPSRAPPGARRWPRAHGLAPLSRSQAAHILPILQRLDSWLGRWPSPVAVAGAYSSTSTSSSACQLTLHEARPAGGQGSRERYHQPDACLSNRHAAHPWRPRATLMAATSHDKHLIAINGARASSVQRPALGHCISGLSATLNHRSASLSTPGRSTPERTSRITLRMQLGGETPARGPLSKQLTLSALLAKTRANTSNMGRPLPTEPQQCLQPTINARASCPPASCSWAVHILACPLHPASCNKSHCVPPLVGREPSCLARLPTASLSLAGVLLSRAAPIDELPHARPLLYHESHKSVPTAPHRTRPLLPLTSRDISAAPTAPPLAFWNHVLHHVPDR